ncbi:hypothetical protein HK405_001613, partial [Cladochytrium tenue]
MPTRPATSAASLDPALSPVAVATSFRSLRTSTPVLFLPALFNRVVHLLAVATRAASGNERCARDPRLAAALVRTVFEPMCVAGARGGLRHRPTETSGFTAVAMAMPAAPAAADVAAITEKVKNNLVGVQEDQHPHLSALEATINDADDDWHDVDDKNGADIDVHHSLDHPADATVDRLSAAILLAHRAIINLASISAAASMHATGPVCRTLWCALQPPL